MDRTSSLNNSIITLLVGDGNFSYSAALAEQYAEENEMLEMKRLVIATDWKPGDIVDDPLTLRNMQIIRDLGGVVSTSTDATKLEEDEFLQEFDCCMIEQVIFNFPHVQTKKMHLGKNRDLLRKFFISVSKLIPDHKKENLTVKVSLCNGQSGVNEVESVSRRWDDSWQIVDQAANGGFVLTKVDNFQTPGDKSYYVNCGYRNRINTSFDVRDAKTFNFIWRPPFSSPGENEILPDHWINELHPSNPLKILVDELNVLESKEKVIIEQEVNCSSNVTPFIHLWIKNLPLSTFIDKFSSICQESIDIRSHTSSKENIVKKLVYKSSNIEVGCVKSDKADVNVSIVLSLLHNTDSRVFFSKYCLSDMSTGSIYPRTFSLDISFWIQSSTLYTKESFIKCCLQVYGLSLESVKLIEIYKKSTDREKDCDNDVASTKVSHCYRISLRCLDLALSSSKSHELYLKLREDLQNKLGLELRYIMGTSLMMRMYFSCLMYP